MALMKEAIDLHDLGSGTVLDIGSLNVNGTYRELISGTYIGVDIVPGPNVDILIDSAEWFELQNVDAIISGQTLEHCADIPKLLQSLYDVLKSEGLICIIVPSAGPPHVHPIWVGNFSKERLTKLVEDAHFEVIEYIETAIEPWCLSRCLAKRRN